MKKLKVIILMIISIALVTSIVSASFLIVNNRINTNVSSESTDKFRIRFLDNNEEKKVMYVDSNYNLSLKDAPYYFDSSNNPIKWVCGDIILNDFENTISNNMDFTVAAINSAEIDSNNYNNSGFSNPTVSFNDLSQDKYVYSGSFDMYYDGSNTNANNPGKLVNSDSTIALQTSKNNEKYVLKLNRDIILTGRITIGAYTGYYGSNSEYSQISYQGFIIGDYCTLDLSGHDIIVANPSGINDFNSLAMIDCWGQLKDSIGDGTVVLEDSSKFYASMVIEDIYHEKRIPYTYFSNDNPFAMYRCPYWTCNTMIKSGAIVFGKYRIDLGGNNSYSSHGDIPLIGSERKIDLSNFDFSSFLIKLDSGYIVRNTSTNNTLDGNNATIKNDMLNQKINYEIYDANCSIGNFSLLVSYSSISVNINSDTYDFFISPYYNFYLYNTEFNLDKYLVFMPGSYLYVDNNSTLNMTYGEKIFQEGFVYGFGLEEVTKMTIPDKNYQPVSGLVFLNELYKMDDLKTVLGVLGNKNTEGYSCKIYQDSNIRTNFWNKLNRAKADIYGTINFIKQNYTQYKSIEFGGEINIYDSNSFINAYNNSINDIKIKLYASTFKSDWCRIFAGSGIWTPKKFRNITGYYNYPLISNGYVMTKFNDEDGINTGKYKYDFTTRLIYNENNLNEAYAFIFNDDSMDNLNFQSDINGQDSLSGKYVSVTPTISNSNYTGEITTSDGNIYIIWHGSYIKNSSNDSYYVGKFFDNDKYKDYLNQKFAYNATTRIWSLVTN